jgi:4-hydroxy-tetrahydrodipicolinate synthase
MKSITDAMLQKNYDLALQLHNLYLKMMNLLFIETNPIPIKYVASLRKLCKNTLRLPLVPVTQQSERLLAEEFQRLEV